MPASVVHIVDVLAVRDRDMATAVTMDMVMVLVHRVARWLAFVVVIPVRAMQVAVMRVVDVIPVRDGHMTASFAMHVLMSGVGVVGCAGHDSHRRFSKLLVQADFSRAGVHHPWS